MSRFTEQTDPPTVLGLNNRNGAKSPVGAAFEVLSAAVSLAVARAAIEDYRVPRLGATNNSLALLLGNVVDAEAFRQSADGADWGAALRRARDSVISSGGGVLRVSTPGQLEINTAVPFAKGAPEMVFRCDNPATLFTPGAALAGPMFSAGGPSPGGGAGLTVEGFGAIGRNGAGTAFDLNNANAMTFRRCRTLLMGTAITSANSFAVTLDDCVSDGCAGLFYSSTKAHNFVGRRLKVYGGATALRFDDVTDNMSIVEGDFEINGTPLQMAGGSSLRFIGNYVEYMLNDPIYTTAPLYGADISQNWFALGKTNWSVQNLIGGQFKGNRVYSQGITWASNTKDIEVGDNTVDGGVQNVNPTGVSAYNTLAGSIAPTPYQAPTLLSGWAQQANYAAVGFRKGRDGMVRLKGGIVNPTASLGAAALTLPAGYRPGLIRNFATGNSSNTATAIEIGIDGQVKIIQAAGAGTGGNPYQACLDGVVFEPNT